MLALLFLGGISLLRAGSIVTLTNGAEIDGKLSIVTSSIHAESSSSPGDTALTDVLEATFGDDPFQLNTFYIGSANQLPTDWVAQNIGNVGTPGSVAVKDGTFTVNGAGASPGPKNQGKTDNLYFVGRPFPDNGEFTARVVQLDSGGNARGIQLAAGIILKDSLEPDSPMCGAQVDDQGNARFPMRSERGSGNWGRGGSANVPLWMRFTRLDNIVYTSFSTDGTNFDIEERNIFKALTTPYAGICVDSHKDKNLGSATFDQISVTPLPSSAQTLQAGVVLQGGSLLAGRFASVSFDPANANDNGEFVQGQKKFSISRSLIAAVLTLPTQRSQLADMGSKTGILMRNGDIMDGEAQSVAIEQVAVNSVLLGITNYKTTEVRACFVHPLQPQPAPFEVRLRDGSIINATAIAGDATEALITDVSGFTVQADQSEIAQIRAGTSLTQDLAQLDWKATPPPASAAPAPANPAPAPAANPAPAPAADPAGAAAAANNAAAPANPPSAPPAPSLVQSWLGKNQEQIMQTGMGTAIEFPMPGKFRAFGVQVALSSDSPPNSTTTIHILSDGREVAKSPPFHAGDPPRFMEITLQSPAHVTVLADSMYAGVKVLYIDPVGIRN